MGTLESDRENPLRRAQSDVYGQLPALPARQVVGQDVYPARIRDRDLNIQVPEANLGLDGSARLAADGGHGGLQGLGAQLEAP